MRKLFSLTLLVTVVAGLGLAGQATPARAHWSDDNGGDPGIALVEMLGFVADSLSMYQDQQANEAYLGSRARDSRLRTAISHAPDVRVRHGARPLVEGWIFGDDDD